jgi:hypothetical protein
MKGSIPDNHMDLRTHTNDVFEISNPDRIISSTIRNTMQDVFGTKVIRSFNKALKAHSLTWDEIPNNPGLFSEVLKKIFGKGHVILEDLITENLYEEMGLRYEYKEGFKFQDHVEKMINNR